MGDIRIVQMTNKDPDFYQTMGPYLSQRHIVKALGHPLWDDPDKTWFVALDSGRVAGFSALRYKKGSVEFCSSWVNPGHRGKGLYRDLLRQRMAALEALECVATTTCKTHLAKEFLAHGFKVTSETKNYTKLRKEKPHGPTQPK